MIEKNGGKVEDDVVKIKKQEAVTAPLEQNFVGYKIDSRTPISKKIYKADNQQFEIPFEGIGVVLTGKSAHKEVTTDAEKTAISDYKLNVEFYLDGELSKTMPLPIDFIERAHELYFQYEIPDGTHTLSLKVLNPHDLVFLQIDDLITYKKE